MAQDEKIQATSPHSNAFPHDIDLVLPLRLESATKLEGKDFVNAWFDCVKCHYTLWQSGERPTTPCLTSLVFDPSADRSNVLVDWDAATATHGESDRRAGSPAFLALDMLRKAAVPWLYRHELEALIWILLWMILQYQNGRRDASVRSWESPGHSAVHVAKARFLFGFLSNYDVGEGSSFYDGWLIIEELLIWLKVEDAHRTTERMKAKHMPASTALKEELFPDWISLKARTLAVAEPEKEPKEVYIEFWREIVNAIRRHPEELHYVYDYIPKSV